MTWTGRKGTIAWLMIMALAVPFPAASPLWAEEPAQEAAPANAPAGTISEETAASEGVEGLACYYKKHYRGKKTHSGSRYDHNLLTAAHPTLPHGTRVKVVNLANNRSVVVTINDRCRKRSVEFIDLSREAAKRLGFLGKGTARVRIIPIEEGDVPSLK